MFYLDDYMELIEELPQEIKDKLTEIRELDLQVQNVTDELNERGNELFKKLDSNKITLRESQDEYESVREEFYKSLEVADEKIEKASYMQDKVEIYMKYLDQELQKFKVELETDRPGITDVLEKRSLELDHPPEPEVGLTMTTRFGNRVIITGNSVASAAEKTGQRRITKAPVDQIGHSKIRGLTSSRYAAGMTYSVGQVGATSTAVASSMITSTSWTASTAGQQVPQNSRKADLMKTYYSIGNRQGLPKTRVLPSNHPAFSAKLGCSVHGNVHPTQLNPQHATLNQDATLSQASASQAIALSNHRESPVERVIWYDPNEPRYCICNQVSYGDMIACDHTECPIEWFHYGCVGVSSAPPGEWFCPTCSKNKKSQPRR